MDADTSLGGDVAAKNELASVRNDTRASDGDRRIDAETFFDAGIGVFEASKGFEGHLILRSEGATDFGFQSGVFFRVE